MQVAEFDTLYELILLAKFFSFLIHQLHIMLDRTSVYKMCYQHLLQTNLKKFQAMLKLNLANSPTSTLPVKRNKMALERHYFDRYSTRLTRVVRMILR